MFRSASAIFTLLAITLLPAFATADDIVQKGYAKQKTALQRDHYQKGSEKGKGKSDGTCKHCHKHHWLLHCKHNAPHAPIMGSAPAMMAPVILVRNQQQQLPQNQPKPEDEVAKLKKLLELLDDIVPKRQSKPAAAQSPPAESESIRKLTELLAKQKADSRSLAKNQDDIIMVLNRLGQELGAIRAELKSQQDDSP